MRNGKMVSAGLACLGLGVLILDSRCAVLAAREGLTLCMTTVIPSLFPFLFLSAVLTGALWGQEWKLLRPLGRFLGLGRGSESLLIAAFLGGYPAGAQAVGDAYRSGRLSREDGEQLLTFVNNAGPSFLFGMTAVHFGTADVWALWGIHILSALMVARLNYRPMGKPLSLPEKAASPAACLNGAVKTMGVICGWIVLFRIFLGFLHRWFLWYFPAGIQTAVSGLLELSIGCCGLGAVENPELRFVLCCAMLSFGGLCVAMQTASVAKGLSLKPYLRGKALQTVFSIALSLLWLKTPLLMPAVIALPFCAGFGKKRGDNKAPSVV